MNADTLNSKIEVNRFEYSQYPVEIRAIFLNTPLIKLAQELASKDNQARDSRATLLQLN